MLRILGLSKCCEILVCILFTSLLILEFGISFMSLRFVVVLFQIKFVVFFSRRFVETSLNIPEQSDSRLGPKHFLQRRSNSRWSDRWHKPQLATPYQRLSWKKNLSHTCPNSHPTLGPKGGRAKIQRCTGISSLKVI